MNVETKPAKTLSNSRPSKTVVVILIGAWAALVAVGFAAMEKYANTAGPGAAAPKAVSHGPKPTLWVFIHPQCPCSAATLAELSRLTTACGSKLDTNVEIYAPAAMPEIWTKGDLYRTASQIPGVQVKLDADGKLAKSFGVITSGQVLLYSKDGRLMFSGGITASRGHEGPNTGADAVSDFVLNGRLPATESPVFGCALGVK